MLYSSQLFLYISIIVLNAHYNYRVLLYEFYGKANRFERDKWENQTLTPRSSVAKSIWFFNYTTAASMFSPTACESKLVSIENTFISKTYRQKYKIAEYVNIC